MRYKLGRELTDINGRHDGWNIVEEGMHPQYYCILKIEDPYGLARKGLAEAAIRGMNEFYNPNQYEKE